MLLAYYYIRKVSTFKYNSRSKKITNKHNDNNINTINSKFKISIIILLCMLIFECLKCIFY